MHSVQSTAECLNSLLRGELAAAETYQQAIARLEGTPCEEDIRDFHAEHREAAKTWRRHLFRFGRTPDQGSGVWGVWAKFIDGTAKLFGETAALHALKEGEEQSAKEYQAALKDKALPPDSKRLIANFLLPLTWSHIWALQQMMQAA